MKFSLPINEQNAIEYAPSQYIAAYLQANKIDGITYRSFHDYLDCKSYNIVLFDPSNAECMDENGKVIRYIKEEMTFQNISVFKEEILKTSCNIGISNNIKHIINNLVQY